MANRLSGSTEAVRGAIDEYRRLGFDGLIPGPTTHEPDEAERRLERSNELSG